MGLLYGNLCFTGGFAEKNFLGNSNLFLTAVRNKYGGLLRFYGE